MDVIYLIFLFFYVISENKKMLHVRCCYLLTGDATKEKVMIYWSTQNWGYKQSFGQTALNNHIRWNGESSAARSLKRDHESGKLVWAPFLFLNWCLVFVTLTQHTQGGSSTSTAVLLIVMEQMSIQFSSCYDKLSCSSFLENLRLPVLYKTE